MPKKRPKADDWADPQGLMLLQSWAQQGLSYAEICANMARVRGVMAASIFAGSIPQVSSSISTKTGVSWFHQME